MDMFKQTNRRRMIIAAMAATLVSPAFPAWEHRAAAADAVYTYQDKSSALVINGTSIHKYGVHAVWKSRDKNMAGQIIYGNLETGKTVQITDHGKSTDTPKVGVNGSGQPVIVWADKRDHSTGTGNFNWDIYTYNVATGVEKKLNDEVGQHRIPTVDGDTVVWQTNPDYEMHMYHLSTGTHTALGEGRDPIVGKGRVAYKSAWDGGLWIYAIATGERKKILDLPASEYVERFVFNGEELLWKQKNVDGLAKYTTLDLGEGGMPVDLTQPVKQEVEYKEMSISDGHAIWLEAGAGGTIVVRGADLASGDLYNAGTVESTQQLVGFDGEKLAIVKAGSIVERTIVRQEAAPSGGSSSGAVKAVPADTVIGKNGGFAAVGETIRLDFAAGTFASDVSVQLTDGAELVARTKDGLPAGMTWAGAAWTWTANAKPNVAPIMTFGLDRAAASAAAANRTSIYRYDEQAAAWTYVGGTFDETLRFVKAEAAEPGSYAVFRYETSYPDMKKHWAKEAVEVLASRWIVNGMASGEFAPNETVTRSQFAKMLVEAAGKADGAAGGISFGDVPAKHWAAPWIQQASAAGWISGYEGGLFKPNAPVTRAEMMVMLANAAGLAPAGSEDALADYSDAASVRPWAKTSVAAVIQAGLIEGNGGKLNPGYTTTRAEAATILYRWLAMKGDIIGG
jgi:hypothetical protein